jgi:hypothetical protein
MRYGWIVMKCSMRMELLGLDKTAVSQIGNSNRNDVGLLRLRRPRLDVTEAAASAQLKTGTPIGQLVRCDGRNSSLGMSRRAPAPTGMFE